MSLPTVQLLPTKTWPALQRRTDCIQVSQAVTQVNDVHDELVLSGDAHQTLTVLHVLASLTRSVIFPLQILNVIEMCPFIGGLPRT